MIKNIKLKELHAILDLKYASRISALINLFIHLFIFIDSFSFIYLSVYLITKLHQARQYV